MHIEIFISEDRSKISSELTRLYNSQAKVLPCSYWKKGQIGKFVFIHPKHISLDYSY